MRKLRDKSWHMPDAVCYFGHDVHENMIYIGGFYYSHSAQVHLTLKEAKWLLKQLPKAIARAEKEAAR